MKTRILAMLGAGSLALAFSNTASHALNRAEPGDLLGSAFGTPLPEGIFFLDDEAYGKRDGNTGRTGVNLQIFVWATRSPSTIRACRSSPPQRRSSIATDTRERLRCQAGPPRR